MQRRDEPEAKWNYSDWRIAGGPLSFGTNRYALSEPSKRMEKYEATFEVESRTDAHAVERLMNRLYDMLREESRTIRKGSADSAEMLEQFKAIRDATRRPTPGKLTIVYESKSEEFE